MAPNAAGNTMTFEQPDDQRADQKAENKDYLEKEDDMSETQETHCEMDHSTEKHTNPLCFLSEPFKFSLLQFLFWMKYYVKQAYIRVWYELSMDPAVRANPYAEAPENEVKLTWSECWQIRRRRLFFIAIHLMAVSGFYYCITGRVRLYTVFWSILLGVMSSIGITAGAHRLWSHHSFKATWQLRLILMIFQTLGVQYSIYNWARDHRLHHKHTDTDADPHNSNRGFFFSHIGWAVIMPHPDVLNKIKTIEMKDIEQDKVAMFQYKFYLPLSILLSYIIPTFIPWYFWNEGLWISHAVAAQFRHVLTLHGTFLINSAAHMWGVKPYDKNINPTENMFVSAASFGDGWHNYHHVFPWDYRNSEFWDYKLNISTAFVDLFAMIGWAYDLKTVPSDVVSKRVKRTGDGTHNIWGWNDKDLLQEDKNLADVRNPQCTKVE